MTLLAVPNVSEGRDADRLRTFTDAIQASTLLLDVHSDPVHNRSVFTTTGSSSELVEAMAGLAVAATVIDLTGHTGVHPRLGVLDVCPIVPHSDPMTSAVVTAHEVGAAIAREADLPVYFYGEAALRPEALSLPGLRRGGLDGLIARAQHDLPPDVGPTDIDPRAGVVCVGARGPLIAFNVYLECDGATAAQIAAAVRTAGGGPAGIRALGWGIGDPTRAQVSMNLIDPDKTGIDDAFEVVVRAAAVQGVRIVATEIVGLVPERFMPDQDAEAARLLLKPGRSVEAALGR
ncbi:MAG: glutamate formimidoyltransferase [Actinomycetota bacterium]